MTEQSSTPGDPAPVTVRIPVAWGEMDALGHVNNAAYFRYFETARIEFLRRIGWMNDSPGSVGADHRAVDGIGVILHSVRARFRAPVRFPDTLVLSSRLVSVESDRFTLAHEAWSESLRVCAAEGEGIIVAYDYARAAKARIPEHFRACLELMRASSRESPS